MCATRMDHARTTRSSARTRTRRGGCPEPSTATGVDDVIRRVCSGRPMTVDELWNAATVLAAHVPSGRMDVLAARVRVAVRLEALGA